MVVLLTSQSGATTSTAAPGRSPNVNWDISYAIGKKEFSGRLAVLVSGSSDESIEDIPWILKSMPLFFAPNPDHYDEAVHEVERALLRAA